MWPFKRKKIEGNPLPYKRVEEILAPLNPLYCFTRDKDYRAISQNDFEKIVFDCWFPHDEPAYKAEVWDCDDFAVAFMAEVRKKWAKMGASEPLAFGYIEAYIDGYHAFIWHIDDKGQIAYYEPQNGKKISPKLGLVRLVEA